MRKSAGLSIIAILIGLAGCAQAPEEQSSEVTQLLDEARAVEADLYAAETFNQAADAWALAQAEIEAQAEKSFMSRSYDEAEELLETAKLAGSRAVYEARGGKERARQDAEAAIDDAREILESSHAWLEKAPPSNVTREDLESMQADLETLETILAEAEVEFETGNYLEARNKAETVLTEASTLGQDVGKFSEKAT